MFALQKKSEGIPYSFPCEWSTESRELGMPLNSFSHESNLDIEIIH
jgi:hypothetical protein